MELAFCECGCGGQVSKPGNRFVYKHYWRGRTRTEETRRKLSEANKGKNNPNYGKTPSKETRRKNSESQKGRIFSVEHRRKNSEAQKGSRNHNYGKKHSNETRRKMSEAQKGRTISAEHRRKLSEANKGTRSAMWGKKFSAEHRRKISEAQKRKIGEQNQNWQGGKSFEPYGVEFNGALRQAIREREGFACQLCGVLENGQAHCCHHIDYDKANNKLENFYLLCHGCHSRTNSKRAFWTNLFQAQVKLERMGRAAVYKM